MMTARNAGIAMAVLLVCAIFISTSSRNRSSRFPTPDYTLDSNEFSIMAYNVYRFGYYDRDRDGQDDDPKPQEEKDAVVRVIKHVNPDILALSEMGDEETFHELRDLLKRAGITYEYFEYVPNSSSPSRLALLSRYPIVERRNHSSDMYTMGKEKLHVRRSFADVDIQVSDNYRIRMITAHLKSKVFNERGQTEMRRNEARLLRKHAIGAMKDDTNINLVVVGDLNDTYDSAALKELTNKRRKFKLIDLRPADYAGDTWTHFNRWRDEYSRIDYILVSPGMEREWITNKSHVVKIPEVSVASDHRPVVAVFHKGDR